MLVNSSTWAGRRVLVTGHTGFKGSWLALWLHQLGAKVTGFALGPPTQPSLFEQARLSELVEDVRGDVRDCELVRKVIEASQPELVFHLAAQPLVRYSYDNPVETYATNVMGTVHVLEASRHVPGVRSVVCVTTDKCYENREWVWPYRECDPMGGHDPYSSSKGAAELAISAYRRSYPNGPAIASVRAGNVIGGGDWAEDRLVPDIIRALLNGQRPAIRNPESVRPWQHVLDALSGYMMLAEGLLDDQRELASAWNFGPDASDAKPVRWIVERMLSEWGASGWDQPDAAQPHEANLLKLDCSKAHSELGWTPTLNLNQALTKVIQWHSGLKNGADARALTADQIKTYCEERSNKMGQIQ
jgi:CDP-glucose 4,6-dehydratase